MSEYIVCGPNAAAALVLSVGDPISQVFNIFLTTSWVPSPLMALGRVDSIRTPD